MARRLCKLAPPLWSGVLCACLAAVTCAEELAWRAVESVEIEHGPLRALFRDNGQSPRVLSGVDALFHRAAPEFDAFDPDSPGASAGLNFEHIICGHASTHNMFTPRKGRMVLERLGDTPRVRLVRDEREDPWRMSSTLTYTLTAPHAIDIDFRCRAHDAALFGPRGYAVLFFANYMNDVEQVALNFLGRNGPAAPEQWLAVDAPSGHADYNGGGTYRHVDAPPLEYDADHNFKLNLWSYDEPRFARPCYFGRAAHGMTLIMMFDRAYTARDEIRFSLFKFKIVKFPRPAFDWQYVIHRVEAGPAYGFRARLMWKRFVSADDCRAEYERWAAELAGRPAID
ncbi:MAG: hypothetical protein AB7O59_13935 [Pirellulales bacterium]